ncbi:hypothetical protein B7494_g7258 [Chlorociboria aeruginascens]|nr:hypothetical protein B7494_g7258 [Chlorociboria aeruginascens]
MEFKSVQNACVKLSQPLNGNEVRNLQPTNFKRPTYTPTDHLAVLRNPNHEFTNTDDYVSPGLHNTSEIYAEYYRKKINFNREIANGQHRHLFRDKTHEELDEIVEKAKQIGQNGAYENGTLTLAGAEMIKAERRQKLIKESVEACKVRDKMLALEGYDPKYWDIIRAECEEEQNQLNSELHYPDTTKSRGRSTRNLWKGGAIEAQAGYDEEEDGEDVYGPESLYSRDDLGPPTAHPADTVDAHRDEELVIEAPSEDIDENYGEDDRKAPADIKDLPSTILGSSCNITDACPTDHDQSQVKEQNTDGHRETENLKSHANDRTYRPNRSLRRVSAPAIDPKFSPYKLTFTNNNTSAIFPSSSKHHHNTTRDDKSQMDDEATLNPLKATPSAPQLSRAFVARAEFQKDYRQACKRAESTIQETRRKIAANELKQNKEEKKRNELINLVSICLNAVKEQGAQKKTNVKIELLQNLKLCGQLRDKMEADNKLIASYVEEVLAAGPWAEIEARISPVKMAMEKRRFGLRDDYSDCREEGERSRKMAEDMYAFSERKTWDKMMAIYDAIQTVDMRRQDSVKKGGDEDNKVQGLSGGGGKGAGDSRDRSWTSNKPYMSRNTGAMGVGQSSRNGDRSRGISTVVDKGSISRSRFHEW